MFKQNIGIMIAVDQLAAAKPAVRRRAERVPPVRHGHRRARRCVAPRNRATAPNSTPSTPRSAIALLFENFTAVFLRPDPGLGLQISDADAITTLSTIWKKTLYGY